MPLGWTTSEQSNTPYAYFNGVLITADSRPDIDMWGFDDYWEAENWVYWYNRNKDKYGENEARRKWEIYASQNGFGSAFNDWKNTNSAWLDFVTQNRLSHGSNQIFQNAQNIVSGVVQTAANLVGTAQSATDKVEEDEKPMNIPYLKILFALVILWVLAKFFQSLRGFIPVRSNNRYSNRKILKRY